jgi:uncharacterized protein YbbC (DUF1343 family)
MKLPTIAAVSLAPLLVAQAPAVVENGIDRLVADRFAPLAGKRVGLITNHTGRALDGRSTIELLHAAPRVTLVRLFSPEHGIAGRLDSQVPDAQDPATGLPIHSLYGRERRPAKELLAGIDALIFDIQDAGCRFYTYVSTMGLALEAAAAAGVAFFVLDRPNPLGGEIVEGPLRDPDAASFTAHHDLPVRHGMTVGELARMFAAERRLKVDLVVVTMRGWRRSMLFDATGQLWIDPSPNLRSPAQALLYPGVGLLEFTNLSVGRGTDTPFELIAAPWLDGPKLAAALHKAELPGLRCVPIEVTPSASKFAGERCRGVRLWITDRDAFRPLAAGIAIACALRDQGGWDAAPYAKLLAHRASMTALVEQRAGWRAIHESWASGLEAFRARRAEYLLYP